MDPALSLLILCIWASAFWVLSSASSSCCWALRNFAKFRAAISSASSICFLYLRKVVSLTDSTDEYIFDRQAAPKMSWSASNGRVTEGGVDARTHVCCSSLEKQTELSCAHVHEPRKERKSRCKLPKKFSTFAFFTEESFQVQASDEWRLFLAFHTICAVSTRQRTWVCTRGVIVRSSCLSTLRSQAHDAPGVSTSMSLTHTHSKGSCTNFNPLAGETNKNRQET